jgi:DNA-directed DNA polymerase III PolC
MFLNCHTYYSLKYGVLSPQELVQYAKSYSRAAIALTDINNTSCTFEFYRECLANGIKPVIGIEFREGDELRFISIAKNNKGFYELNELLTDCSMQKLPVPATAPAFENCYVIYPFDKKREYDLLPHELIGIYPSDVRKLPGTSFAKQTDKMVALCPVTVRDAEDFTTHRLLRAIDHNTLITKLQPSQLARSDERFYHRQELESFYELFPELLTRAEAMINDCNVSYDLKASKNKKYFTPAKNEARAKKDDEALLYKHAKEGFEKRYSAKDTAALDRLSDELNVIFELNFPAYFLITHDFIKYAHSRGFEHVGRGSGANSLVSYCMGITEVDPIELNLYFERFIKRTSPPDFDIDFCWDERDEVIDYIFKRYGDRYVAMIATYTTFRDSSAVREVAKAYGLPKEEIDKIVNAPNAASTHHYLAEEVLKIAARILDFPNYLGIHAGGILISEEPLTNYTALQLMPKGIPIVHFDMYVAEDIGYHKFDVLSQRGLGHIKHTLELLKEKGVHVDIHDTKKFMRDEKVNAMLGSGEATGAFYVESPAMRGLLKKLNCNTYPVLVAASSIIRPGVAQSGMMKSYIYYHHHPHELNYIHPVFEQMLGETYGVMVYQEDVMKVAHHFGGLSLDDADLLRRSMTGKNRGNNAFAILKEKYFANCKELGYSDEMANEVWRQMESFAGYSFCKAHSASYAVESYQSLYLKTYYPLEFMVGVINNFGGFYRTEIYVHEARRWGALLEAPCINTSEWLYTLHDKTIYVGFIQIKDFEQKLAQKIAEERQRNGRYRSLADFINRVPIGKEQLNILIRVGAFRFTGKSRQQLLWEKNEHLHGKTKATHNQSLDLEEDQHGTMPALEAGDYEDAFEEMELLGFPLCSPFDLLKTDFRAEATFDEFYNHIGKTIKLVGYYVDKKYVRTKHGDLMHFGCWLDHKGNYFDTVHFPQSLRQSPYNGKGLYLMKGKVVEEFGYCSLEVERMAMLPMVAPTARKYAEDAKNDAA